MQVCFLWLLGIHVLAIASCGPECEARPPQFAVEVLTVNAAGEQIAADRVTITTADGLEECQGFGCIGVGCTGDTVWYCAPDVAGEVTVVATRGGDRATEMLFVERSECDFPITQTVELEL